MSQTTFRIVVYNTTQRKEIMKIFVPGISDNPVTLMRRAGYVFQRQEGGEMSFVRVLAQSGYPRFHCYTKVSGVDLFLNMHLDQKKHTYGADTTRHHGEYEESKPVTEEGVRLLSLLGEKAQLL